MNLIRLGVTHRTAPIAVREKLAYGRAEAARAAAALRGHAGIAEVVVISTCNRLEVIVAADDDDATRAVATLAGHLARDRKIAPAALKASAETGSGPDVVAHLIRVAAGIDSQVVGEAQILGQVRDAHEAALRAGATGPVLNGVFNRAIAAAKRIRTETEIGRLPASVASVAVDLAERIFGELKDGTVMLLGTGETAELVAESLVDGGAPRLLVAAGRRIERASDLVQRFGGTALALDDAIARLPEADVVIAALAAKEPVVRAADVEAALKSRRGRPMFFVDLGVPRNIEPATADLADAYLYNLDDLKAVADLNRKRRAAWLEPAARIVAEEADQTGAWLDSLEAVPLIVELQRFGEACRAEVMGKAGRRIHALPPETRDEVEYLTRAIVAKLLHRPISRLKDGANGRLPYAEVIRKLFGRE